MIKNYGISLSRLLYAGAWVDGELSRDEVNQIEAFLDTIPGLSDEDFKRIRLYGEFPMTTEESRLAAEQFVDGIRTEEEKDMALLHLEALVKADRIVTPEERVFYVEMLNFLQQASVSTFSRFSKLFKGRNKWKPSNVPEGQDRETLWMDHYLNNPTYFRLRVSYMDFDLPDDLPEKRFEEACLYASLMVLVEISGSSYRPELIAEYLEQFFEASPEVAAYLVDLAAAEYHRGNLDLRRQGHQLTKICEFTQVDQFYADMLVLFEKNKTMDCEKFECIRKIGRILKMDEAMTEASIEKMKQNGSLG